jgi:gamma-glutamylcyclotransferase (GGCT)/AIG2-like uncharacterized protein YtfP
MSSAVLFAYGTLLDAEIWRRVVGESLPNLPGKCRGFAAYWVDGAEYPGMIAESPATETLGRAFLGVENSVLARLDAYEGQHYTREIVEVDCSDGLTRRCWTYLWKKEFAHLLTTARWPTPPDLQYEPTH